MTMIGKQRGTSDKRDPVEKEGPLALPHPAYNLSCAAFQSSPLTECLEQARKWRGRETGKWESGKVGKQGRHVHPFLMRCLGVSKHDGCLTEGNPLPQVWSVARANDIPFGNVQRGK